MIYDVINNQDGNLEKIVNFYSLLYNLHDFPYDYSPEYILEKWEHWIGEEVSLISKRPIPTPVLVQFENFKHKWGANPYIYPKIECIFYFMAQIENLNMLENVALFKLFHGDIRKISSEKKNGLHPLYHGMMLKYLELNENNIKAILRDIQLEDLIED